MNKLLQVKKISLEEKKEYHFCHTADWHLDYNQYQKKERWQDFINAANECTKLIIDEKPDFVIHCGDFFHHFKPTPGALRFAIKILNKYKEANIPFYVIRGNHDSSRAQAQRYGGTILKFLDELGYLIYVQDEQINLSDNITFTGVGEYGQTIASKIEEVLRNNPLDNSKFNILALHGYLQGQISDSIFDITGYQLASMGFNYIALGHYHKQWEEAENNIYCPGSTEQTSMNDWGKPDKDGFFKKSGYYSIKTSLTDGKWNLNIKRKEFNVRPKGRFKFNFDDTSSIEDIIKNANEFVKKHDLQDAIIRFDFIGELPSGKQHLINFTKLPAIKKSNALHIIPNQQVSGILPKKGKSGISSQEALIDIIEKNYGFKKSGTAKWLNLMTETISILGQKTISNQEADEVKAIYDLITEISDEISESEMTRVKLVKKKNVSKPQKVSTPKKTSTTKKPVTKSVKQSNLSQFIDGGE
ncbi:MAG: DNA repair exonuclease [Asgard group archaeon]|nr:DNA repair exonuclease [Asgard group archaeon]